MTAGPLCRCADPVTDSSEASGRFDARGWLVSAGAHDPDAFITAHEWQHHQLQNSTTYGVVVRLLHALADATNDPDRAAAAGHLVGACRETQEAYATWIPAVSFGWSRAELARAWPDYLPHFDAMCEALGAVERPYLRFHAAQALARACMQPPLDAVFKAGFGELELADLPIRLRPDHRFRIVRTRGVDWQTATRDALGAVGKGAEMRAVLDATQLSADMFAPALAEGWTAVNNAMYDAVTQLLAGHGMPSVGPEGHFAVIPDLIAGASSAAGRSLPLTAPGHRPTRSRSWTVAEQIENESMQIGAPLIAQLVEPSAHPSEMVADAEQGHLFLTLRPGRALMTNYAPVGSISHKFGPEPVAMLRRTVVLNSSRLVQLLDVTSCDPAKVRDGPPVLCCAALSLLASSWIAPWREFCAEDRCVVIVDTPFMPTLAHWIGRPNMVFRYVISRIESFGRLMRFLVGAFQTADGGPGSNLIVRPVTDAAARVYRSAFLEIDPAGERLVLDPRVLEGREGLLSVGLAHIVGEEVRFSFDAEPDVAPELAL